MKLVWHVILHALYLDYDTEQDFFPQFEATAAKLTEICETVAQLDKFTTGDGPFPQKMLAVLDQQSNGLGAAPVQSGEGAET